MRHWQLAALHCCWKLINVIKTKTNKKLNRRKKLPSKHDAWHNFPSSLPSNPPLAHLPRCSSSPPPLCSYAVMQSVGLYFSFGFLFAPSAQPVATMRSLGFWVILITTAASLIFLSFRTQLVSSPENIVTLKPTAIHRNFKKKSLVHKLMMEDYPGLDPAPSSKASIQPKPIEHGTPLMPYAPAPASPPPMSSSF